MPLLANNQFARANIVIKFLITNFLIKEYFNES